ncbi:MAG: sugar ABC transporter substrate-binding protein [Janthinobacterium lividum]
MNSLTIGFANQGPSLNAYAAEYLEVFNAYAKELGVRTIVTDAQLDPARQATQIRDIVTQHPDVLIVWPANGKAVVPSLRQVHQASIPVVVSNATIDETGVKYQTAYTGPHDYEEAKSAGKMMVDALGGKGSIVMLNGMPGYNVSADRYNGFMDYIKNFPSIKVLDSQPANFSQEKGQALMENMITRFGRQIDGVYSVDSAVAIGALSAIKAAAADGKVDAAKIKMTDCTMFGQIWDAIKSGEYTGSVSQPPAEDAKLALRTAILIAEGQTVPVTIYMDTPAITKANVETVARPRF